MSHTKKNFVVAALFIVAACSKQPETPQRSATTPLVEQSAADPKPVRIEELNGKFAPGGIAASYRATFSDGQIKSLEETREPNARTGGRALEGKRWPEGVPRQTGVYEFLGARLMKYQGAALSSADKIELEFDERGKVLVSRAGEKEVSPEEISAIRDRAQSLRSHAVANHDLRGHDKP